MKISDNFTLAEFTKSETAMKKGYREQFAPSPEIVENLKALAVNIAEPIRAKFGSFSPTVAYRCERTNKAVGGAIKSEHLTGCAFDETFLNGDKNISREVFEWIIKGGLTKWSKLILEFPDKNGVPRWLHIGYDRKNLTKQVLVIDRTTPNGIDYFKSKHYK